MKKVHPIRDKQIIEDMKEYLKKRNERDYVLFVLGINTGGMRIGDILKLKVGDVRGEEISTVEMKTEKIKEVPINRYRKCLTCYAQQLDLDICQLIKCLQHFKLMLKEN